MPNWTEVQSEIQQLKNKAAQNPLDQLRRQYLKSLYDYTGRNTITYYSGFVQKQGSATPYGIYDGDINALMNVVKGLEYKKGLDLILHTPGGLVTATESFVDYLHKVFGSNIRCIIPQLALSGGTMIACACKEIIMGKQSSIGPIDPQLGSIAAHGVIEEYEYAKQEIEANPASIPIWQVIYGKLNPSIIVECQHAMELSSELVTSWLRLWMFKDDDNVESKVEAVVKALNNHSTTKTHGRHISATKAKEIGLKVSDLEDDNKLQDLVLTVHHAYMETFNQSNACKIVENHTGVVMITNVRQEK